MKEMLHSPVPAAMGRQEIAAIPTPSDPIEVRMNSFLTGEYSAVIFEKQGEAAG